jgi:hypothetical protein
MSMAPPTGGSLLDGGHTLAWAMIPASVALIGLIVALVSRRGGASTPEKAELSSAA